VVLAVLVLVVVEEEVERPTWEITLAQQGLQRVGLGEMAVMVVMLVAPFRSMRTG